MAPACEDHPHINKLAVRGADCIAGKICWPQQCGRGLKVLGPSFGFLVSHNHRARRNHRGSKNVPEKPLTEQPSLCLSTFSEVFNMTDMSSSGSFM